MQRLRTSSCALALIVGAIVLAAGPSEAERSVRANASFVALRDAEMPTALRDNGSEPTPMSVGELEVRATAANASRQAIRKPVQPTM